MNDPEIRREPLAPDTADDEEEIPRSVMLVIVTVALVLAVLYLALGGHNHLH